MYLAEDVEGESGIRHLQVALIEDAAHLAGGEDLYVADVVALPAMYRDEFAVAEDGEDGALVPFAGDEAVEDAAWAQYAGDFVCRFAYVGDVFEDVEEEDYVEA